MVAAAPGDHERHFREAWQVERCHDATLQSSRAWAALGASLLRAVAALPVPESHRWNGSFVLCRFFFFFHGIALGIVHRASAGNPPCFSIADVSLRHSACSEAPLGSHGPAQNREPSGSCPSHEGCADVDGRSPHGDRD